MPKLDLVERGIRRVKSLQPGGRPRLSITPSILRQLRAQWSRREHDYDVILSWAACCTAFFRIGELTEQSTRSCNGVEVSVDSRENPSMVKIHLRQSKTDQFGRGISIYLGTTGDELCPVSALMAYLALRGGAPGPLFRLQYGPREIFTSAVRVALSTLGYSSMLHAGHSFRIGAATTAAEWGVEDSVIKMLGRWVSSAYSRYVRTPRQTLAAVSRGWWDRIIRRCNVHIHNSRLPIML